MHGGHFHSGVFFGFGGFGYPYYPYPYAYGYPYPYPYPYPYAYYAPPSAPGATPPDSPGPPQPLTPPPPPATYAPPPGQSVYYFCPTTKSYYPYVATCAVAWQSVPVMPPAQPQYVVHAGEPPAPPPASTPSVLDTSDEAFLDGQGESRVVVQFRNEAGQACRVLQRIIVIDGVRHSATGTICQRADGRWVISPQDVPETRGVAETDP